MTSSLSSKLSSRMRAKADSVHSSKPKARLGSRVRMLGNRFKWRKSRNISIETASTLSDTKHPTGSHVRVKKQKRSLTVLQNGVHVGWKEAQIKRSILTDKNKTKQKLGRKKSTTLAHHDDKAMPAHAAVTLEEAVAARHARVLERIIASGTSIELEEVKAKRAQKSANDKSYRSDKVQPYSVVAPHKVKELKEALLDVRMANGIIGELRAMEVDEDVLLGALDADMANEATKRGDGQQSNAIEALEAVANADTKALQEKQAEATPKKRKVKAKPVRVVCLNYTDEDAASIYKEDAQSGTHRVTVQTLYAHSKKAAAQGEQAGSQSNITEESSAPTAGMMTTAATAAGGAIGAIGQYLGYRSESVAVNAAATTAVAAKDGVSGAGALLSKAGSLNFKPVGDIAEYGHEVVDDVKDRDYKEALGDGVRLATAGLEVVQPAVGAAAEAIEDQVLPANKPVRSSETSSGQSSSSVTTVQVASEVSSAEKSAAQDSKAAAMGTSLHSEISVKTTSNSGSTRAKPFTFDTAAVTNFISSPTSAAAVRAADQAGLYDALAMATGAAVKQAQGGAEAMQEVKPPADRMAIFIHWWGFELTLPAPSLKHLGTVHSVSGAFITFLTSLASSTGAPELLPFIRYISTFMDMEFHAIKTQNHGDGVVVAATWLMPLALVPRPWDYGVEGPTQAAELASAPTSQHEEARKPEGSAASNSTVLQPSQNGQGKKEEKSPEHIEKKTDSVYKTAERKPTKAESQDKSNPSDASATADGDVSRDAKKSNEDITAPKSDAQSERTITPPRKGTSTSAHSKDTADTKSTSPSVPERSSSTSQKA